MGIYLFSSHRWCRPRRGRWHWIERVADGAVLTACGVEMRLDERSQDFAERPMAGRCLRCRAARKRWLATYSTRRRAGRKL